MNNCKNRQRAAAAAAGVLGVLLLAAPEAAAEGFASGTALCLASVLPALFPFFVVCELLTAAPPPARLLRPLQRLLGLEAPEAAQAVALSWLGGYAVSAQLAGRLYGAQRISRRDARRLLLLGCCSGPGFVIGCVGGLLLGRLQLGVLLYAAQLAANLAATACLDLFSASGRPSRTFSAARPAPPAPPQTAGLPRAISSAVSASLSVCGCVVFFRIVGAVIRAFLPVPPLLLSAALEISAGCADAAARGGQAALYGCCAVLSLLGLSVWSQIQLFSGDAFCPRALLLSRVLHFFFLQGLIRLCVRFLPGSLAVCSSLSARVVPISRLPPDAALLGFSFLCAALYKVRQNLYNK